MVVEGRGHDTMNALTLIAQEFLHHEESLLKSRVEAAERRLAWGRWVALVGGPVVALIMILLSVVALMSLFLYVVRQQSNRTLDLVASEYP